MQFFLSKTPKLLTSVLPNTYSWPNTKCSFSFEPLSGQQPPGGPEGAPPHQGGLDGEGQAQLHLPGGVQDGGGRGRA